MLTVPAQARVDRGVISSLQVTCTACTALYFFLVRSTLTGNVHCKMIFCLRYRLRVLNRVRFKPRKFLSTKQKKEKSRRNYLTVKLSYCGHGICTKLVDEAVILTVIAVHSTLVVCEFVEQHSHIYATNRLFQWLVAGTVG